MFRASLAILASSSLISKHMLTLWIINIMNMQVKVKYENV